MRATYPTAAIDRQVRRYRIVLAAIAAIVLGATAIVGWWIARWVTRPLVDLRDSARRVSAGDLAERAKSTDGPPEVQQLARDFNEMVARLERTVLAQEAFVADASHQLRSPLTALRLRIENLQAGLPEGDAGEAEATMAELDRLNRLVNGLLTLARADRRATERTRQHLTAIARERVTSWEPAADDEGIRLTARGDGDPVVDLAEGALEQVLDNLIANALEAAPSGSTVQVDVSSRPGLVELTVSDRGPGLAAELREHAFDRFWSERGAGSGSGLGLAIVKRLVEADGGSVHLEEHTGGGLRAVVRYPVA